MDRCFKCGRIGHWASQCGTQPCRKCRVRMDWHTQAGLIECAWRGYPCLDCGQPPHPDGAADRCDQYTHPDDTPADRALRAVTPWRRDSDPDTWYVYPHGHTPVPRPVTVRLPDPVREHPGRHSEAARQVAESRTARAASPIENIPEPIPHTP